ncbi:MAG: ribonuclease III [Alphaproteobacteria bacterium]|nr:ribonuclease III [Alphaproteobacteria bacterium]
MGKTKPELPDHIINAQKSLEDKISYHFVDQKLLIEAMTHPSINNSIHSDINNQRLEFLGDRVINLIIADAIFSQVADEREGVLTRFYHDCIDNITMTELARQLSLGQALWVQPNTDLANTDKVLADALEALIGAIWRDAGYDAAKRVVLSLWKDKLATRPQLEKDAKSRLQEYALKHFSVLPEYSIVDRTGPDHAPQFTVAITLNDQSIEAKGSSRRLAEQHAAAAWLDEFSHSLKLSAKPSSATSSSSGGKRQ